MTRKGTNPPPPEGDRPAPPPNPPATKKAKASKKKKPPKPKVNVDDIVANVTAEQRQQLLDQLDAPKSEALPRDTEDMVLMKRILWVRDRVTRLGKDSSVSTGGGSYKAISHDKVTAFIRPKLGQAGIFTYITCQNAEDVATGAKTNKGRNIVQHRALYKIHFVNVYNATDTVTVHQWGYADDYGDKAPGKATSYAFKYALLKMFMIETGEEDEARVDTDLATGGRQPLLRDDENTWADIVALAEELFGDNHKEKLAAAGKRRFLVDDWLDIPLERKPDLIRSLRSHHAKLMEKRDE